jgi:hypothetical protein
VQLINTEDMVLIGPGSEWFWTAVSGIVLAVTFLAIYRQLALARSANAFEQIERMTARWDSELAARHKLAILEAIHAGAAFDAIPEASATFVGNFWEQTAALVRAGHVDLKNMYPQFGPTIRYWHAVLEANTQRYRRDNRVRVFENFDWLADQMTRVDRARGVNVAIDEEYVRATLSSRINRFRGEIEQAEELRGADAPRNLSAASPTRRTASIPNSVDQPAPPVHNQHE